MKKFFKFGKDKNKNPSREPSPTLSRHGSGLICGYEIREKDLGKLHKAVWNNDLNKVKQLAKKDASPLDKENRTPLHLACARGFTDIAQELLEWKAKTAVGDNMARTPLLKAVECKQDDCVRLLLEEKADPNVKDKEGEACLHYAARDGQASTLEILLESSKIYPDIKNKHGQTPLHLAVKKRNLKIIKLLLDGGADIDAQDAEGHTSLMEACIERAADVMKFLLENRADINKTDRNGWTVDDFAGMEQDEECGQMLAQYGRGARPGAGKQRAGASNMYGAPAADDDDFSETEPTSRMSGAGVGESWAESEDESEAVVKNKPANTRPELLPSYSQVVETSADIHLEEPDYPDPEDMGHVPGIGLAQGLRKAESPQGKRAENIVPPPEEFVPGAPAAPVSARSNTSAHSGLSLVDDKAWSDDESLFSSPRDAKQAKPSLIKMQEARNQAKAQEEENTDDDSWPDSDSLPMSARVEKGGATGAQRLPSVAEEEKPQDERNNKTVNDFFSSSFVASYWEKSLDSPTEDVGNPLATSTQKLQAADNIAQQKRKQMMAELGISDVESISDPDFSPQNSARSPATQPPGGGLGNPQRQAPAGGKKGDGDDSDWDSTVASDPSPRNRAASAKIPHPDEILQIHSDTSSKPINIDQNNINFNDGDSNKDDDNDDDDDEDFPDIPTIPDVQEMTRPKPVIGEDEDVPMPHEQKTVKTKHSLRYKLKKIFKPRKKTRNKGPNHDQEDGPSSKPANIQNGIQDDEDSKWDDEDEDTSGGLPPPPLPSHAPPPTPPAMSATVFDETDGEEEEEEEESTWEREKRLKKLQEQAPVTSAPPVDEWEKDMEEKRNRQHQEAIEELKREQEEQERRNLDEEKPGPEETGIWNNVVEERRTTNYPVASTPKSTPREEQAHFRDAQDERANKISEQRHQVDREIHQAAIHHVKKMHTSFDEEDTFNDVPEMDSPRKVDALGISGHKVTGEMMNTSGQQDDDCLSYSSTEYEASIHEDTKPLQQLAPLSFSQASDSTNVMRLQQQLRETQQKLEKEKTSKISADNKRKSLEKEREELIQKLEDVSRAKSQLEQNKIDLDAKIRNIQYQLNEETEKRKNFEVLHQKTKEQLNRKEEQYTQEVEEKQKSDLVIRNMQMELRTAQTSLKQVEEEKEDQQRQLNHERNARILQEQINDEQVKFQQTLNEDLNKSGSQADMVSRIEAADESKKVAFDTIEKVQAELYATKVELERIRSRGKDDHDIMTSENEELHQKIEEFKADIKLNEEALAHASLKYNIELTALKTDNTKLVSSVETEKSTRDKLEGEVESLKTRLEATSAELERAQQARNELERRTHTQHEDLERQLERRDQEVGHLKDNNQSLSQRLNDAESKVGKIENELHIANATLIERTNQLSTIQRELDQRRTNQETLDDNYRKEKEENARLSAKLEATQEKATSLQHEIVSLRQQLDEARLKFAGEGKEEGDKFSLMLTTMRNDHDKSEMEEKVRVLETENARLTAEVKHQTERVSMVQREMENTNQGVTSFLESDVIAQLEREKQEVLAQLEEEKKKTRKAMELRKTSDSKLESEQNKITQLQKEVTLLKTHLKAAKKRLKMDAAQNQMESEIDMKHQLDGKSRQLEAELSALRGMERSYSKMEKAKRKLEEDLSLYRSHINTNFVARDELERLRAELEAKARQELNQKLEEVNRYLEEQSRARDKLDRMRDNNETEMKTDFDRTRNDLLDELSKLRKDYKELLTQHETKVDDAKRFKNMFEHEVQTREQLATRLDKANTMAGRAQTVIDRQRESGSIYGPTMENGWTSGFTKSTPNHGMNDVFSNKIRQELDRSIAKHMEKGPHIDIAPPARSFDDSTVGTSFNKSRSDYLGVLQKNYFV